MRAFTQNQNHSPKLASSSLIRPHKRASTLNHGPHAMPNLERGYRNCERSGLVYQVLSQSLSTTPDGGIQPIIKDVIGAVGVPLPENVGARLGAIFHFDFSRVRLHTGDRAAASARAAGARAYTVGQHVVFGDGEGLDSDNGRLLAHELVHVVQQSQTPELQRSRFGKPNDPAEREADVVSEAVVAGSSVTVRTTSTGGVQWDSLEDPIGRQRTQGFRNYAAERQRQLWLVHQRDLVRWRLGALKGRLELKRIVYDYALLSDAAYSEGRGEPPEGRGWSAVSEAGLERMSLNPTNFDTDFGFHAKLFYNRSRQEYVLAFRGTNPGELNDWSTDANQALGRGSAQYDHAMTLAERVDAAITQVHGSGQTAQRLTFTGHSLGGGLASAASVITGNPAVTFDAAGVHPETIRTHLYRRGRGQDFERLIGQERLREDIQAYYVRMEILSSGQDITGLPNALGTRIPLTANWEDQALLGLGWVGQGLLHRMDVVLGALETDISELEAAISELEGQLRLLETEILPPLPLLIWPPPEISQQ